MMNNECAPIIIFAYNRLYHLQKTVEYLCKNYLALESDLFIYSDAPKNIKDSGKVAEVRKYLKTIDGFKKVIIVEREKNFGLEKSIIDGVTTVVNMYGKVIVLEDDLITSPYFLTFINEGLRIYENEDKVCQIMGYSYFEKYQNKYDLDKTFFVKGASCLGWGTWKDSWQIFNVNAEELLQNIKERRLTKEFNRNNSYNYMKMLKLQSEGKTNSWAIRWYASTFLNDMYTLYPYKSFVYHIGHDGEGTNYHRDNVFDPLDVPLNIEEKINVEYKLDIKETQNVGEAYEEFLKQYKLPLINRIKIKLKGILK